MELQWPLILFTTIAAWSVGVFGAQSLLALKGEGKKSQMTCWIVSAVLLAVSGIAVFMTCSTGSASSTASATSPPESPRS